MKDRILKILNKNPTSTEKLSMELNIPLNDLQSLLIDLQLDDYITQNIIGDWVTVSQIGRNVEIINKKKATLNLSSKAIDDLDILWIILRKELKHHKRAITKTLIVETLLEFVLQDYQLNDEYSHLFKSLSNK